MPTSHGCAIAFVAYCKSAAARNSLASEVMSSPESSPAKDEESSNSGLGAGLDHFPDEGPGAEEFIAAEEAFSCNAGGMNDQALDGGT